MRFQQILIFCKQVPLFQIQSRFHFIRTEAICNDNLRKDTFKLLEHLYLKDWNSLMLNQESIIQKHIKHVAIVLIHETTVFSLCDKYDMIIQIL